MNAKIDLSQKLYNNQRTEELLRQVIHWGMKQE